MKTVEEALKMSISFAEAMRNGYNVQTSKEVIDACTEALEETTKAKWISVKDRLPEFVDISAYEKSSNDLLILIDGKHIYIGSYIWDSYSEETEFCMRDLDGGYEGVGEMEVTHWMPLPESPKECLL